MRKILILTILLNCINVIKSQEVTIGSKKLELSRDLYAELFESDYTGTETLPKNFWKNLLENGHVDRNQYETEKINFPSLTIEKGVETNKVILLENYVAEYKNIYKTTSKNYLLTILFYGCLFLIIFPFIAPLVPIGWNFLLLKITDCRDEYKWATLVYRPLEEYRYALYLSSI